MITGHLEVPVIKFLLFIYLKLKLAACSGSMPVFPQGPIKLGPCNYNNKIIIKHIRIDYIPKY